MPTPVNLNKLLTIFSAQVLQGIKYRLGGKAPSLKSPPSALERGIDCSGEVRLLIYQATDGAVTMPDGSWNQRAWCEANLQEVPYSQAMAAKPGELYIGFITAHTKGAGNVGHVWLITQRDGDSMAETMESYGGHGIGSRPANTAVLTRLVHKCFKIPTATVSKPTVPETYLLNGYALKNAEEINGRLMAPVREVTNALNYELNADSLSHLRAWPKAK